MWVRLEAKLGCSACPLVSVQWLPRPPWSSDGPDQLEAPACRRIAVTSRSYRTCSAQTKGREQLRSPGEDAREAEQELGPLEAYLAIPEGHRGFTIAQEKGREAMPKPTDRSF